MDTNNPYIAPETAVSLDTGNGKFSQLDFKQLKKMYHRSVNVAVIAFLMVLGIIGCLIQAGSIKQTLRDIVELEAGSGSTLEVSSLLMDILPIVFIVLAVFYVAAATGLYQRSSWGKVLGIIACIFMLISIPIGTIIGVVGLVAIFGSPQLFGKNRYTHKELKAEFKLRKANGDK